MLFTLSILVLSVESCKIPDLYNIKNDKLNVRIHGNNDWGNSLSPYWFARILSYYGGYEFINSGSYNPSHLLHYLPKHVNNSKLFINMSKISEICEDCGSANMWYFPHECEADWNNFVNIIGKETKTSLNNLIPTIPQFQPYDTVIHIRCDHQTFFAYGGYGPIAFSYYKETLKIPPKDINSTITIVMSSNFHYCIKYEQKLKEYVKTLSPNSLVVSKSSSIAEDFAYLVYAPTLISSQSSFCMMASYANNGTVYYPRGGGFKRKYPTSYPPYYYVDAKVLIPSLANSLGINKENAIEWLVKN
jgi:hypothetical protein